MKIQSENGTPLDNQTVKADHRNESGAGGEGSDFAHVRSVARIALYDDLRSAPRVTEVHPAPTAEFIENLASKIYEQAKSAGGSIPYTVIREVSENFIHARFAEATVSILDDGNTIRFADQGPGIPYKEQAQIPGFTSAVEPMKRYIRGVGSGLPIVKEYLAFSHGSIAIEDNLGTGAVVTVSLRPNEEEGRVAAGHSPSAPAGPEYHRGCQEFSQPIPGLHYLAHNPPQEPMQRGARHMQQTNAGAPYPLQNPARQSTYGIEAEPALLQSQSAPNPYASNASYVPQPAPYRPAGLSAHPALSPLIPPLSQRERDFLPIFLNEGALGVTDLSRLTGVPQSSTYVTLSKLEQGGLIEKTVGQKRILTDLGYHVASSL